jgi:hypothetical protein
LAALSWALVEPREGHSDATRNADQITCLRAFLMKSEHHDWLPQILQRLQAAASVFDAQT